MRRETIEQERSLQTGFTMIELLIVIAIILIIASFAAPIYSRIITRSHEAVLKDDLFTMRETINRYTLDNHKPPESLQALVKSGYFSGGLPVDPFTGSNETWRPDIEQVHVSPEKTFTRVVNVHSASNTRSGRAEALRDSAVSCGKAGLRAPVRAGIRALRGLKTLTPGREFLARL